MFFCSLRHSTKVRLEGLGETCGDAQRPDLCTACVCDMTERLVEAGYDVTGPNAISFQAGAGGGAAKARTGAPRLETAHAPGFKRTMLEGERSVKKKKQSPFTLNSISLCC